MLRFRLYTRLRAQLAAGAVQFRDTILPRHASRVASSRPALSAAAEVPREANARAAPPREESGSGR